MRHDSVLLPCCADLLWLLCSFTELYVGETTSREDLCTIVAAALAGVPRAPVDDVVDFYTAALRESDTALLDSAGQKPQYRCGALRGTRRCHPCAALAPVTTHNGAQWRLARSVQHTQSLVIS